MAVEKGKVSTVRLSDETRMRLKTVAAARHLTMEVAFSQAVEFWLVSGPIAQEREVRASRELQRAIVLCKKIFKTERARSGLLTVLDGLSLLR